MVFADSVEHALEAGHGERRGDVAFVPLCTLDSGTRIAVGPGGVWLMVPETGEPRAFRAGAEHVLTEALECARDRFDSSLEEGARAAGLPPDDVLFAFPVIELVRSVLATRSPYLTRLALLWLRPTELRPLRADIARVAADGQLTKVITDLAARLTVPE